MCLVQSRPVLTISDLCRAEFVAAVSMHVRMRRYPTEIGEQLVDDFEGWVAAAASASEIEALDTRAAMRILRRFDLKLRAPDAIHLGICQRLGAQLLSYDVDQVAAARALGIPLIT